MAEITAGELVKRVPFVPGIEDSHGNVTPGYGDPVDVPNVAVAPTGTVESLAAGERVTDKFTLYFNPGGLSEGMDPRDRFIVGGLTYEVQGSPLEWRNPFTGETAGTVIYLEKARG